jgi:hypothetical protein
MTEVEHATCIIFETTRAKDKTNYSTSFYGLGLIVYIIKTEVVSQCDVK